MLKYAFLAGTMIVAAPVLAQTMTPAPQTAAPQSASPTTTAPQSAEPVADPSVQAQPQTAAPGTDGAATGDTAAATTAQPASGAQVASIVDQEFPTYDKDANGGLSQAEFSSWMVTLRTASDASTKAESAETKTWVKGAFAQADTDKSKSISKTELTGFLSKGQS